MLLFMEFNNSTLTDFSPKDHNNQEIHKVEAYSKIWVKQYFNFKFQKEIQIKNRYLRKEKL